MRFKKQLKNDLEELIISNKKPILDKELLKQSLVFTFPEILNKENKTNSPRFRFVYLVMSFIIGIFAGVGVYSFVESPNNDSESEMQGIENKVKIKIFVDKGFINECAFFINEVDFNEVDEKIFFDRNDSKLNIVKTKSDGSIEVVESKDNQNFNKRSLTFFEKNGIDYCLISNIEKYETFIIESSLPFTTNEVKESFENVIGKELTKEFLNSKDSGIFATVEYNIYTDNYYLAFKTEIDGKQYIGKYNEYIDKIEVTQKNKGE